jgi:hypothetical protein
VVEAAAVMEITAPYRRKEERMIMRTTLYRPNTRQMRVGLLSVVCVLILVGHEAWAFKIFNRQNPNPQTSTNDCEQSHFLDLGGGNTTMTFPLTQPNQSIAVFVNAECSVAAGDYDSAVHISLVIQGGTPYYVNTYPADFAPTLCTSRASNALDGWTSLSMHSVGSVGYPGHYEYYPGTFTLQVQAWLSDCTAFDSWRLDDLSVIVIEDKY